MENEKVAFLTPVPRSLNVVSRKLFETHMGEIDAMILNQMTN